MHMHKIHGMPDEWRVSRQIQYSSFEKKLVGQNMSIYICISIYTPSLRFSYGTSNTCDMYCDNLQCIYTIFVCQFPVACDWFNCNTIGCSIKAI